MFNKLFFGFNDTHCGYKGHIRLYFDTHYFYNVHNSLGNDSHYFRFARIHIIKIMCIKKSAIIPHNVPKFLVFMLFRSSGMLKIEIAPASGFKYVRK